MIVLDGGASEATPGAMVLLYRYFGRPGQRDDLPDRVSSWVELQRRKWSQRTSDRAPVPLRTLTAIRGETRAIIRFVPGSNQPDALVITERPAGAPVGELQLLGLSPRESEVLQLLYSGASNAAIGNQLHISTGTVKKHLDNLYRKLGVTGRVQAVSMGLELLADQPDPGP